MLDSQPEIMQAMGHYFTTGNSKLNHTVKVIASEAHPITLWLPRFFQKPEFYLSAIVAAGWQAGWRLCRWR